MASERIRVTLVLEYTVDPDLYPGSSTPTERAEVDRKNFEEDPETLVALIHDDRVVSVRTSSMVVSG